MQSDIHAVIHQSAKHLQQVQLESLWVTQVWVRSCRQTQLVCMMNRRTVVAESANLISELKQRLCGKKSLKQAQKKLKIAKIAILFHLSPFCRREQIPQLPQQGETRCRSASDVVVGLRVCTTRLHSRMSFRILHCRSALRYGRKGGKTGRSLPRSLGQRVERKAVVRKKRKVCFCYAG